VERSSKGEEFSGGRKIRRKFDADFKEGAVRLVREMCSSVRRPSG
jgi:transposase-like protein